MTQIARVHSEPIRKLLRAVSLNRARELEGLFDELSPVFELDRETERNLFQAILGDPNIIRMGLKCSVRLQAHAYAAGNVIQAIGRPDEREELMAPAKQILTWSVGLDLQRWLNGFGADVTPEQVLPGGISELPKEIFRNLNPTLGEGLFRYATAFILLHELGHLKFGHTHSTYENEKEVDRFAAEWLSDAAFESTGDAEADRLAVLFGMSVALVWFTVFNIYFGQKQLTTHPEGYDRLWQVLDQVVDWNDDLERQMVWHFVGEMLVIHMWSAGFDFDERDDVHMQGDPRDKANYLIDRISKWDWKR